MTRMTKRRKIAQEIKATQQYLLDTTCPGTGVLRKFLSPMEIKAANLLVKEGKMHKGTSDDRQRSVVYFINI